MGNGSWEIHVSNVYSVLIARGATLVNKVTVICFFFAVSVFTVISSLLLFNRLLTPFLSFSILSVL